VSLKKNVVYNTILTVSNVAFPVITTPYVSRVLGVENIGIVNFAITYASYFALFAALGIPKYGIREIAKHNNGSQENRQQVFSELFVINILSTIIFSIVYLATIFSVPTLYQERIFLLITGVSVFLAPLNLDWFFSGREKFKLVTIRSLIAKIISLGGLFIFVHTREDIVPYLILTVVANLSSQLWNFGYMLKKEVKLRLKHLQIKKHINAVFVLFASNVAISIYTTLSTLLLGFMSDYTQVGYYTSAIKVSGIILPVVTSIAPVMIARINTIRNERDSQKQIMRLLNNSFGYMMMLAVPATIGLMFIAPRFVPLFFGTEFIPATASMQLLSLLIVIIGLSNLFGVQVLVAMGHENKFLLAVLFGAVSNFCLNLLLIGSYGSMGASIASVIAEILVTVAAIVFALKITPIQINKKSIYQPVLAALPIIPVSFILNNTIKYNLSYLAVMTITSCILYVFIMICIFKNEQANKILYSIIRKKQNQDDSKI
jgi:O-antigen/teichoic acid export membrane protein